MEAARGEEWDSWARAASATANALYSSNLRDDSKATARNAMESLVWPRAALSEATCLLRAAWPLTHPTGDKCSAIFRSDSLGTRGLPNRTLPSGGVEGRVAA